MILYRGGSVNKHTIQYNTEYLEAILWVHVTMPSGESSLDTLVCITQQASSVPTILISMISKVPYTPTKISLKIPYENVILLFVR